MIQRDRHVPLRPLPWDERVVASAIDEIVSDALAHFRPEGFWPSHPLDGRKDDGHSSLYMGAAGMPRVSAYMSPPSRPRATFSAVVSL